MSSEHSSRVSAQNSDDRPNTSNSAAALRLHVLSLAAAVISVPARRVAKRRNRFLLNKVAVCTAVSRSEAEPGCWPAFHRLRPPVIQGEWGGSRGQDEWRMLTRPDGRRSQVQPVARWRSDKGGRKKTAFLVSAARRQTGEVAAVRARDHAITEKKKHSKKLLRQTTKARRCKTDWTLTPRALSPAARAFHKCLCLCVRVRVRASRVLCKPSQRLVRARPNAARWPEWEASLNRRSTLCSRQWSVTTEEGNGVQSPPWGITSAWPKWGEGKKKMTKLMWENDLNPSVSGVEGEIYQAASE